MKDMILTIAAIVGLFIILPFLILWIRDKVLYRSPASGAADADAERFKKRLLSSDLDAVARHYGCKPPRPLLELYGNTNELLSSDIDVWPPGGGEPIHICFYNPADYGSRSELTPAAYIMYSFSMQNLQN